MLLGDLKLALELLLNCFHVLKFALYLFAHCFICSLSFNISVFRLSASLNITCKPSFFFSVMWSLYSIWWCNASMVWSLHSMCCCITSCCSFSLTTSVFLFNASPNIMHKLPLFFSVTWSLHCILLFQHLCIFMIFATKNFYLSVSFFFYSILHQHYT